MPSLRGFQQFDIGLTYSFSTPHPEEHPNTMNLASLDDELWLSDLTEDEEGGSTDPRSFSLELTYQGPAGGKPISDN